ncbi:MAG: O-antigen ligase family protein [Gammaproteobacteria bacterium]|nr:O-antigen ligase family protein [Gammaproteobacteria bacterium]
MRDVASASMAVLFLASLFYIRKWPVWWRALSRDEWLLLSALGLYTLSGLISYYNVSDDYEFVKHMGRYLRFLLIVPVYLLSGSRAPLFKYLVAGAIVSGPLYLNFALISAAEDPGMPASGNYHHITFGDGAMLNVLFLLAVLLTWKTRMALKVMMAVAIVCALYASILSQARGAWLALPVCGAVLLYFAVKYGRLKIKVVLLPLLLLGIAVLAVSPARELLEDRVSEAVQEVEAFASGEKFDSSVGGRLAMWDIAVDVWRQHPVIGTGLGDFDLEIEQRQEQGIYESITVHASVHNIYLQALATTGTVGFLVLCFALVIQPLRLFYRTPGEKPTPARLGGIMLVLAYAVFGLTESWILRAPVISVFLIYLITLSVTVSKLQVINSSQTNT